MAAPGQPPTPTIHPRTRPEAEDVALRMRATNDWFRHDGKNIEHAPPPPVRLQGKGHFIMLLNPVRIFEKSYKA